MEENTLYFHGSNFHLHGLFFTSASMEVNIYFNGSKRKKGNNVCTGSMFILLCLVSGANRCSIASSCFVERRTLQLEFSVFSGGARPKGLFTIVGPVMTAHDQRGCTTRTAHGPGHDRPWSVMTGHDRAQYGRIWSWLWSSTDPALDRS